MSLSVLMENLLESRSLETLDRALEKGCEKCTCSNTVECKHCKAITRYEVLKEQFEKEHRPSELELLFADGQVLTTNRVIYRKYGINPTPEQVYKEIEVTRKICIDRGCQPRTVDEVIRRVKIRHGLIELEKNNSHVEINH